MNENPINGMRPSPTQSKAGVNAYIAAEAAAMQAMMGGPDDPD